MSPVAYDQVLPLFQQLPFAYHFQGVAAGNSPARIWTDRLQSPTSAYMWDRTRCHYLVGRADSSSFNRSLALLVAREIAPWVVAHGLAWHKVYSSWPGKQDQVSEVFVGQNYRVAPRVILDLHGLLMPDWSARVPEGISIQRIDSRVLQRAGLSHRNLLVEEIESCWPSLQDFLSRGFGFCLIEGDEIASWCTAEYVSEAECGCGIETMEHHQNKGYATLTAAAFAEHCAASGIFAHWDAFAANLPSLAVAEKVGFVKSREYEVLVGDFAAL